MSDERTRPLPLAGLGSALARITSGMSACQFAAAFTGYEEVIARAARYQKIRTSISACTPPEWHSDVDRELWFRSRRMTEMDAVHSLWRDVQLGRWHPFRPLDLAAERARLDALGQRIADLRRTLLPSPPEAPCV